MLANSLAKTIKIVGLSLWVVFAVILGQTAAGLLIASAPSAFDDIVGTTLTAALGYVFAIIVTAGVPLLIRKSKPDFSVLGINRLLSWSDIGLGILALLPYLLLASAMIWLGTDVLRFIDPEVGQQISFNNLYNRSDYVLAFITLVVVAPFAEELLFRGYFQGTVAKKVGKTVSIVVVALVFGLFHLPGFTPDGVVWQWGAMADTFSLGIVVGTLRLLTSSIWAGIILHALKNGVAYYFLFIAR